MAWYLTTYGKDRGLEGALGYDADSTLYLALGTAVPALPASATLATFAANEIATNGYARSIARFGPASGGSIANSSAMLFGPFIENPPSVSTGFVTDAAAGTVGNVWSYGIFNDSVNAGAGDVIQVATGNFYYGLQPIPVGLVAQWKFFTDALDSAGPRDLVAVGSEPSYGASGANFDGSTDGLKGALALNTHEGCSITGWIKPDTKPAGGQKYRIFQSGAGFSEYGGVIISIKDSGLLMVELHDGSNDAADGVGGDGYIAGAGTTSFFGVVYDNVNGKLHIYTDRNDSMVNVFYRNTAEGGASWSGTMTQDLTDFRIGVDKDDSSYRYDGHMSDIRVYDFPMNATEMEAVYTGGVIPV